MSQHCYLFASAKPITG